MNKLLFTTLAVALIIGGSWAAPAPVLAKDTVVPPPAATGTKTVAVVSLSGYDRIMGDVAFFGNAAGRPGLEKQAEGMLMFFAQGLEGLDHKRPWGAAAITTDGMSMVPLVFLPVSDTKALLGSLVGLVGPANEESDGVFSLEKNNQKFFVKEKDGWAFVSPTPEALTSTPSDPVKLLEGLNDKYELAIQVHVANVPEVYRSMFLDQLKAGALEDNMRRNPGESDDDFAMRQKVMNNLIEGITNATNEADRLTLGWAIDSTEKQTAFDFTVVGKSGTNLAKQFGSLQETTSAYSGFVSPKAALAFRRSPDLQQGPN